MTQSDQSKIANKAKEKKALGRGLAALFNDTEAQATGTSSRPVSQTVISSRHTHEVGSQEMALEKIIPNPDQPRKNFDAQKLEELSQSIAEQGLIQPIVVKKGKENKYLIVAGERRWRASKLAGLKTVPVFVRDPSATETENDLASLVENIQREELNPIELAEAYERLLEKKSITQEGLAKKLGVSRVSITNTLRLLKLPEWVRPYIIEKKIKEGHARILLSLEEQALMRNLVTEIIENGLSVRAVEARVKELNAPKEEKVIKTQEGDMSEEALLMAATEAEAKTSGKNPELKAIEEELRRLFGTKVGIKGNDSRGIIELYYYGSDSFERVLHLLRSAN